MTQRKCFSGPSNRQKAVFWLEAAGAFFRLFLSRIAAQQMIGKDFSVTRDHGKFFDKQGTLFMATLHPAALLRNPKSKISAFEDFVALREKIEQVCDHTYNRS